MTDHGTLEEHHVAADLDVLDQRVEPQEGVSGHGLGRGRGHGSVTAPLTLAMLEQSVQRVVREFLNWGSLPARVEERSCRSQNLRWMKSRFI